MSRWLVTQNDSQFTVENLAELRSLAASGQLGAHDMVQPPGASKPLYASEIPELDAVLDFPSDDDDLPARRRSLQPVLIAVLVAVIAVGGWFVSTRVGQLGEPPARLFDNVSFSQVVVTAPTAPLLSAPEDGAGAVTVVPKDSVLELLSKRGFYYKTRVRNDNAEGWVRVDEVLPMYLLGGGDVRAEYDPLYNPDRYVMVQGSSWMQYPDRIREKITVFRFSLRNTSKYDMTDMVLLAVIKDSKGHELERVEFKVGGVVPADSETLVGTLKAGSADEATRLITETTVNNLAADDPDVRLRYEDGVEVVMETSDFTEARIEVVEVRAVPAGG